MYFIHRLTSPPMHWPSRPKP